MAVYFFLLLIFNTIIFRFCVKVKKMSIFSTNFIKKRDFVKADEKKIPQKKRKQDKNGRMKNMKIYDYHGKKTYAGKQFGYSAARKGCLRRNLPRKCSLNDIFLERDSISRIDNRNQVCFRLRVKSFCKSPRRKRRQTFGGRRRVGVRPERGKLIGTNTAKNTSFSAKKLSCP